VAVNGGKTAIIKTVEYRSLDMIKNNVYDS
jgi:hypothetical protein